MLVKKIDVINKILNTDSRDFQVREEGVGWAPSNIALCKYWGKRDEELNLPMTSSLSLSLGDRGAFIKIRRCDREDQYWLNGEVVDANSKFAMRLKEFLDLFRSREMNYLVETTTNVPINTGFASSACGFAALVLALNDFYQWELDNRYLSILARLGSGSACRSIFDGFVKWQLGERADGMDSFGVRLDYSWPSIRVGLLTISEKEKHISSREAMRITAQTSSWYPDWVEQVPIDLEDIMEALQNQDFLSLGEVVENNSVAMHTVMRKAVPPIGYSTQTTFEAMAEISEMRDDGISIFYTQDAGPNLKLLFRSTDEEAVLHHFPTVEIVAPFDNSNESQLVLVDKDDKAIRVEEKLETHIKGYLHRAFSVVILRRQGTKLEMLLQQRSKSKYHSANLWSNSCCGHPKLGESIFVAAERRLYKEMRLKAYLNYFCKFHYRTVPEANLIENEIDHLLVGFYDGSDFCPNPTEVQNYRWVELYELSEDVLLNPKKYTVWFPKILALLLEGRSKWDGQHSTCKSKRNC